MSASGGGIGVDEAELLEVGGRDGEGDRVADGLVEAIVGAVAEQEGLPVVGALVEVVAELVVDGGEVVGVDLDADLDAEVVDVVDVPGGGVADDVAVAGLGRTGSAPRRCPAGGRSRGSCRSSRRSGPWLWRRRCGRRGRHRPWGRRRLPKRRGGGGILWRDLLLERGFEVDI